MPTTAISSTASSEGLSLRPGSRRHVVRAERIADVCRNARVLRSAAFLLYVRDVPRRPRHLLGDGTFHITARGVARSEIFLDDDDYRAFLVLFRDAVNRFAWRTRAFCLMPNHFHLVVSTQRIELSAGMHRLNCLYAMRFRALTRRRGSGGRSVGAFRW